MAYNEESNTNTRLQELGGSDFKIVDGQPDIKGWKVKDREGRTVGEVDELIFDAESRKVRYIVLDMDGNDLDLEEHDVLIPIGLAELHEDDDDVILTNVTTEQLAALPEYDGDINSEHEGNVRNAFAGAGVAGLAAGDRSFYDHEHFNDDNLYQRRRGMSDTFADSVPDTENKIQVMEEDLDVSKRNVQSGGVRIESRIREEEVQEDINLKSEHVNIERNPVNRPATEADLENMDDVDMELRTHEEVPVVHKDARVVEEISLNKTVEENDETIHDTVRKTEVDIDRIDSDDDAESDVDDDDELRRRV
ncbi:MAG: hypothetical protein K0S09_568 [Sphingobacteriaceae bacterium]|jgi:uncharacterized protein (TIGR02271 family)|nr:hypothetical protein [Sphingobacteriaceae bacterium]